MFDHITVRVPDLAAATSALTALLDELEIEQTTSTPSFSVWGNFALTKTEDKHQIARRVHIAFIAPTTAHVDRFGQAGINARFAVDGPAGPRPKYAGDYYAASVKDPPWQQLRSGAPRGSAAQRKHRSHRRTRERRRGVNGVLLRDHRCGGPYDPSPDRRPRSISVGGSDGSLFLVAGELTHNLHIAFSGDDNTVCRFHSDAIASGYRSNGEPGERLRYHDGYYDASCSTPTATTSKSPTTTTGTRSSRASSTNKEQRCQRSPHTTSKDNARS